MDSRFTVMQLRCDAFLQFLSFSFETTLSARSNKAVITLCSSNAGLCDVYVFQVLVCMHWFSIYFYRDGFVMISLD